MRWPASVTSSSSVRPLTRCTSCERESCTALSAPPATSTITPSATARPYSQGSAPMGTRAKMLQERLIGPLPSAGRTT